MKVLFCVLLTLSTLCSTGQFEIIVNSVPDSIDIAVNGVNRGKAPQRVRISSTDAVDKVWVLTYSHAGYVTKYDTIKTKPKTYPITHNVSLELDISPNSELTEQMVVFSKLLADKFVDKQKVGRYVNLKNEEEPLKWDGTIRVGEKSFENTFNDLASKAGIRTPATPKVALFDVENNANAPRFAVGARLVEYDVTLKETKNTFSGEKELAGSTKMKIEWQVMDLRNQNIMYTGSTTGVSRHRNKSYDKKPDNLGAFSVALAEFLRDGKLRELVMGAKGDAKNAIQSEHKLEIAKVKNPGFEKLSDMIKHAERSCVTIVSEKGIGSGAVISSKGHVLTAYHVVEGVSDPEVHFSDGLKMESTVVAYDKQGDVALLKLVGAGYKPLAINRDFEYSLGEDIVTIGTPRLLELGQSVSKGIISGKREIDSEIYIQANISVSPGNSGGPLLNMAGEIIGVIVMKLVDTGVEGIGFAVPIGTSLDRLGISIPE